MSPLEYGLYRLVFTLDSILVAIIPWLKAFAALGLLTCVMLPLCRVIRRKKISTSKRAM